ncbi:MULTISPECIES: hypothetical protein [Aphanothece]|uniref:hypothetical protein n=1 Tax=Aphanothece TaxID=1121 RepID=UPI003984832D
MDSFQQAFTSLLALAPGPVFPKARQLYLRKYPLEGKPADLDASPEAARFRTFLLQEEIQEASDGLYRVRALGFAVVHWQAPQTNPADYRTYLRQRWQLEPDDLTLAEEAWFRSGGAYARFTAMAVYERHGGSELRVSLGSTQFSSS